MGERGQFYTYRLACPNCIDVFTHWLSQHPDVAFTRVEDTVREETVFYGTVKALYPCGEVYQFVFSLFLGGLHLCHPVYIIVLAEQGHAMAYLKAKDGGIEVLMHYLGEEAYS